MRRRFRRLRRLYAPDGLEQTLTFLSKSVPDASDEFFARQTFLGAPKTRERRSSVMARFRKCRITRLPAFYCERVGFTTLLELKNQVI
jgi:hypothetical protein